MIFFSGSSYRKAAWWIAQERREDLRLLERCRLFWSPYESFGPIANYNFQGDQGRGRMKARNTKDLEKG